MTDAAILETPAVTSVYRSVGEVDLHVVTAGDPEDPLVVLLHGFPDFWYGWRKQIQPLADAGYRVLVPDMRGYNLSDAPSGLDAYRMSTLSTDISRLIASEGRSSAHVVGHDWGAAVAWDLALRQPDVVNRLGIVNVPHPTVMRRTLKSSPRQLRRSWYIFWFQVPFLPEWALRRGDSFVRALQNSAKPSTFSPADLQQYRASWEQGSIRAMIDYYRAVARRPDPLPRTHVEAPTLICWGQDDVALLPEMAEQSRAFCVDGTLETYPDASHWVHVEEADAVTARLLDHLET